MSQGEAVTADSGPGFVGRSRDFLVAARAELGKVTWPTRDELIKATRMVVIFAVILGIAIGQFRGLLDHLKVPPDVRDRSVTDLREAFFYELIGSKDKIPTWLLLAARVLETGGDGPVDGVNHRQAICQLR